MDRRYQKNYRSTRDSGEVRSPRDQGIKRGQGGYSRRNYWRQAANLGHPWAMAMLGNSLVTGEYKGVMDTRTVTEAEIQEGIGWLCNAAANGKFNGWMGISALFSTDSAGDHKIGSMSTLWPKVNIFEYNNYIALKWIEYCDRYEWSESLQAIINEAKEYYKVYKR